MTQMLTVSVEVSWKDHPTKIPAEEPEVEE